MPLAFEYVAGLYRLFWEQFQPSISMAPYAPYILQSITLNAGGDKFSDFRWDCNYDGINFREDASGTSVVIPEDFYRSAGNKAIAVQATAPEIGVRVVTKNFLLSQYPINITYPDGYDFLKLNFSTPYSDSISQYKWDFGDWFADGSGQ